MSNKIKQFIETVFQKKSGRWKRVLIFLVVIIITFFIMAGSSIILITNIGYNKKDGFYWKPWSVQVNYEKRSGGE